MKNRGWLVVIGIFALMLAACGSGDATEGGNDGSTGPSGSNDAGTANPDDTVTCGNGTCETGEGCSSCENDCACTAEYTTCREDACVDWDSINPLLKNMEGRWLLVEPPNTNLGVDVTVDLADQDCTRCIPSVGGSYPNPNPNEPGDACIKGLRGGEPVLSFMVPPCGSCGPIARDEPMVKFSTTVPG